jgi:hypothetical protein
MVVVLGYAEGESVHPGEFITAGRHFRVGLHPVVVCPASLLGV